jgi:hypothetical protein
MGSFTKAAFPLMPSGFAVAALAMRLASGIASIRPAPNKGVVRRLAMIVASFGTNSINAGAIARRWSSGPPNSVIGSKTPFNKRANRVTVVRLAPPAPP